MPLRPPEFVVGPDEPFKNDALGREASVKTLAEIIAGEERAAVISVNGGFGSGKSAYLGMLAAHLRGSYKLDVSEFNAWQQSYTQDPLVDLVSALAADRDDVARRLMPVAAELAGRVAWRVLTQLLKAATAGIADLEDVNLSGRDSEAGFESWNDACKRVAQFKDVLGDIVDQADHNSVVIVDELDRCRPDYAIDMLNVVRHLFDAPGVVIVLGVNRDELEHRVQEVFGAQCDGDVYLRRFVDLPINLRLPNQARTDAFVASVVQSVRGEGLPDNDWINASLELLLVLSGASLRDVEQLARLLPRIAPRGSSTSGGQSLRTILSMLVLRHIDRETYERFVAGRLDAVESVAAVRRGFASVDNYPESAAKYALSMVEDQLLMMRDGQGSSALQRDDFDTRYVEAGLGSAEEAGAVRASAASNQSPAVRGWSVRAVADRIDLVA